MSAPAPARSSSAAAPAADAVWPEAAGESAAPGSRWTGSQELTAEEPAPRRVEAEAEAAGRVGQAGERTPPPTADEWVKHKVRRRKEKDHVHRKDVSAHFVAFPLTETGSVS